MWGGYPYGRDGFVRHTGLMRGSRETCIAVRSAKYRWWSDLRDRYIRRHKLTLTWGQLQHLETRIAKRTHRLGYSLHDNFYLIPPGQVCGLEQLHTIYGQQLRFWKLGNYDQPDGDYCDTVPNTTCSFCGEAMHLGRQATLEYHSPRNRGRRKPIFCGDRCKRASNLLFYGVYDLCSRGSGRGGVQVPIIMLIDALAKGIQKQHPIAMKILERGMARASR